MIIWFGLGEPPGGPPTLLIYFSKLYDNIIKLNKNYPPPPLRDRQHDHLAKGSMEADIKCHATELLLDMTKLY